MSLFYVATQDDIYTHKMDGLWDDTGWCVRARVAIGLGGEFCLGAKRQKDVAGLEVKTNTGHVEESDFLFFFFLISALSRAPLFFFPIIYLPTTIFL